MLERKRRLSTLRELRQAWSEVRTRALRDVAAARRFMHDPVAAMRACGFDICCEAERALLQAAP